MKNIYNYLFILALCLILNACSTKIPFNKWSNSGQFSAMLWYMPNGESKMTLPLLVQAEWANSPSQKGSLALVLLHGGIFGQCHYDNSELICKANSSFAGTNAIVANCAIVVSAVINDLQNKPMKLAKQWDYIRESENNKLPHIYSFKHKNIRLKLEVTEIIWQ